LTYSALRYRPWSISKHLITLLVLLIISLRTSIVILRVHLLHMSLIINLLFIIFIITLKGKWLHSLCNILRGFWPIYSFITWCYLSLSWLMILFYLWAKTWNMEFIISIHQYLVLPRLIRLLLMNWFIFSFLIILFTFFILLIIFIFKISFLYFLSIFKLLHWVNLIWIIFKIIWILLFLNICWDQLIFYIFLILYLILLIIEFRSHLANWSLWIYRKMWSVFWRRSPISDFLLIFNQ